MELLNALLAGFFLWLLVYNAQRNAMKRIRREAGELVLRVNAASGLPRKRWPWELRRVSAGRTGFQFGWCFDRKRSGGVGCLRRLRGSTVHGHDVRGPYRPPVDCPGGAGTRRAAQHVGPPRLAGPADLHALERHRRLHVGAEPAAMSACPRLELVEGAIAPEQRAAVTAALGASSPFTTPASGCWRNWKRSPASGPGSRPDGRSAGRRSNSTCNPC